MRTLRSVLLLVAVATLPACDGCGQKKEPTVVIVDDGAAPPRHLRKPFDLRDRDGGIPRFHPHGSTSTSTDAPAPPIE